MVVIDDKSKDTNNELTFYIGCNTVSFMPKYIPWLSPLIGRCWFECWLTCWSAGYWLFRWFARWRLGCWFERWRLGCGGRRWSGSKGSWSGRAVVTEIVRRS
jgi:hypothetical protein